MRKLFGTDGIRGVANRDLTPELALKIGRIAATYLTREHPSPFFLIARDTRISGHMLEGALAAGIAAAGVDVRLVGVISTPGAAYLTRFLGASGGVMISASHNSVEYNGLKFFNAQGYKLSDEEEQELEKRYFSQATEMQKSPVGGQIGRIYIEESLVHEYLNFLKEISEVSLEGYRLVLDCANGAVYQLAPALFKSLGAEVHVINDAPNGTNINVNCGSTNPSKLQNLVREKGFDLGLAFDGDADRLIAVDEKGRIANGDVIMAACASHLKKEGKLAHNTLVATIMSNGGLDIFAEREGFSVKRTKVGDRYVLEEMLSGGYNLGGEQSGHVIFSEHSTTGDGLLTAIKLLQVMFGEGTQLSALVDAVPHLPQLLVNCQVSRKDRWQENPIVAEAVQQTKDKLGAYGRVVVRPSGTEPLMRVMVEGQDEALLHKIANELAALLAKELN
ncbi:MAG: phosphoglucosamine mutase [Dethiobacteria bacterium]